MAVARQIFSWPGDSEVEVKLSSSLFRIKTPKISIFLQSEYILW